MSYLWNISQYIIFFGAEKYFLMWLIKPFYQKYRFRVHSWLFKDFKTIIRKMSNIYCTLYIFSEMANECFFSSNSSYVSVYWLSIWKNKSCHTFCHKSLIYTIVPFGVPSPTIPVTTLTWGPGSADAIHNEP